MYTRIKTLAIFVCVCILILCGTIFYLGVELAKTERELAQQTKRLETSLKQEKMAHSLYGHCGNYPTADCVEKYHECDLSLKEYNSLHGKGEE